MEEERVKYAEGSNKKWRREGWVGREREGKSGELVEMTNVGNFDQEAELGKVEQLP